MDVLMDVLTPQAMVYPTSAIKNFLYLFLAVVLFITGFAFTVQVTEEMKHRELAAWENFLKHSATDHSNAITVWINHQYEVLSELASNVSLQIYMTELAQGGEKNVTDRKAQAAYLNQLLNATAKREGFTYGGLVLLDTKQHIVASTPHLRKLDTTFQGIVNNSSINEPQLTGPYKNEKDQLVIAFKAPVFVLQGDNLPAQRIGSIVGIRNLRSTIYPILKEKHAREKSLEAFIIRAMDDRVEYYIPREANSSLPVKYFLANRDDLAAIEAIKYPGNLTISHDRNSSRILAVATEVKGTGWHVIQQVSYEEAMAHVNTLTFFYLFSYNAVFALLVMAVIIAKARRHKRIMQAELVYLAGAHMEQRILALALTVAQTRLDYLKQPQPEIPPVNNRATGVGALLWTD